MKPPVTAPSAPEFPLLPVEDSTAGSSAVAAHQRPPSCFSGKCSSLLIPSRCSGLVGLNTLHVVPLVYSSAINSLCNREFCHLRRSLLLPATATPSFSSVPAIQAASSNHTAMYIQSLAAVGSGFLFGSQDHRERQRGLLLDSPPSFRLSPLCFR